MALADLNRSPRCQHVHYSGRPCKAPARRGRNYCVFHQAAHLDPGGCVLPIIEDLHSYQLAIVRIARALADDVIDSKKATALLYAMQLAGYKLEAFVKQRAEIENPAVALRNDVVERYQARRDAVPWFIPEKDLANILKEIAKEQLAEPNDHVEISPQSDDRNIGVPPVTQPSTADCNAGVSPATPTPDVSAITPAITPEVAERPTENSPTLPRRDNIAPNPPSAVGTTETPHRNSSVPTGLAGKRARTPGVKTPGYSHHVPPGRTARTTQLPKPQPDLADCTGDRPPATGLPPQSVNPSPPDDVRPNTAGAA